MNKLNIFLYLAIIGAMIAITMLAIVPHRRLLLKARRSEFQHCLDASCDEPGWESFYTRDGRLTRERYICICDGVTFHLDHEIPTCNTRNLDGCK